MAKGDKKGGDGKSGLLRVVIEGAAESMTKVLAEKGLAALLGGGTAPNPAPTASAPSAPTTPFDIQAAATRALTEEAGAINGYCQERANEAARGTNALLTHMRRR